MTTGQKSDDSLSALCGSPSEQVLAGLNRFEDACNTRRISESGVS